MDGSEATGDTLLTIYRESADSSVELFGREVLLKELEDLKEQQKALGVRVDEITNTIKADLGENERGTCPGYLVTWKPQQRKTFQAAKFAKDHPAMDLSAYYKTSQTRVFTIKSEKEAV